MMQQGLGALMPQQPAGQAPENPVRMAAAMDVVTSDAEENILDPRTLALIKYKDAVAAMQAADQLIAASQPTPTPPTVAERTKLAAQQGIMGLASRLAPGLQQQGNRMAQQAGGGGLPQLSAPNMAGMAGGGIVGYAEGGAVDTDVQRYTEQYRAIMAAVQNASTPEQKAQLQQRLREIQSTFDPETVARAHMQMSGQGMAAGGEVRGFAEGKKVEGAQPKDFVPVLPREGLPASLEELIAEAERQDRIRAQAERPRETARNEAGEPPVYVPTEERRAAQRVQGAQPVGFTPTLPREGQPTSVEELIAEAERQDRIRTQAERAREQRRPTDEAMAASLDSLATGNVDLSDTNAAETGEPMPVGERFASLLKLFSDPGGREGQYQPGTTGSPSPAPTAQPAREVSTNGSTINLGSLGRDRARPESNAPRATNEVPAIQTPQDSGIVSLMDFANRPTNTSTATQSDFDAALEKAALGRAESQLNYDPEQTRRAAEEAARAAYGVPAELTELLRARLAALDAPLYSPEEQRRRELRALLGGLASSGYIAESGPAASRAIMGIEDEVRADARTRAEKQFDLAGSLIEQERTAGQSIYTAGQDAINRAETGANQAMQSGIARLNSLGEVGAAQALQDRQMQLDVIKAQIEAAAEQKRLGRYDAQTNATLAATVRGAMDDSQSAINTLLQTLAATPPESQQLIQDAINALNLERNAVIARFNELTGVGAAPIEPPTTTTGGISQLPEGFELD